MADGLPELAGRTVLVCGARFAGQAAARALLARGAAVVLTDRDRPSGLDELIAAGAQFAGSLDRLPPETALVVTSPGWPPDNPLFADAAARGIEVIGELEFAWRLRGAGAADWLVDHRHQRQDDDRPHARVDPAGGRAAGARGGQRRCLGHRRRRRDRAVRRAGRRGLELPVALVVDHPTARRRVVEPCARPSGLARLDGRLRAREDGRLGRRHRDRQRRRRAGGRDAAGGRDRVHARSARTRAAGRDRCPAGVVGVRRRPGDSVRGGRRPAARRPQCRQRARRRRVGPGPRGGAAVHRRRAAALRPRPAPQPGRACRQWRDLGGRQQGDEPPRRVRVADGIFANRVGGRGAAQGSRRRPSSSLRSPTGWPAPYCWARTGPRSPRRLHDTRPMSP